MDGFNGHVLIKDLEDEAGIAEIAYVNLRPDPRVKNQVCYKINKTYDLYLQNDYGIAHEPLHLPSNKLLEWIENHKKEHGIFYNTRQRRLHCIQPLTAAVRKELVKIEAGRDFSTTLACLYRRSNQVRMYTKLGKKPLDTAFAVALEEHRHAEVPEYQPGETVRGRISEIWHDGIGVVLDRGGRGKVYMKHLAWDAHSLIDPRERVSPGQEIEARVLEMKVLPPRQEGEKAKILINLSLLKEAELHIDADKIGRIVGHGGKTVKKISAQSSCRIDCDFKAGRVVISGATAEAIKRAEGLIQECLGKFPTQTRGQTGRTEKIAPPTPKKRTGGATAVVIPKNKIGFLIGSKGSTIIGLKAQSRCGIWCNDDGETLIRGNNLEDVQKAVDLITRLIPAATWDGKIKEESRKEA